MHPTFLYELLWNLLVAALVVWADRRFRLGHGRAFAVYVAGYTLGRFFIELMRTDPATRVFGDIRINVLVAGSSTSARSRTWCWCASHVRSRPSRRAAARLRRPARPHTPPSPTRPTGPPPRPTAPAEPAPAAAGEPPERPDHSP